MNFDQMMDAWKTQDEAPLYGVNSDLLQLVLRHEQEEIRRSLRWEQWITYAVAAAMAALAGGLLWAFLYKRSDAIYPALSVAGIAIVLFGVGAFWLSRRRQELRERGFGNSLAEEIRRNLSLIDYQLSRAGRWSAVALWSAPVMLGSILLYWLIAEINGNETSWFDFGMIVFIVVAILWTAREASRQTRQELLPRRQRLLALLERLEAGE